MTMNNIYSVLMSLYVKEQPLYLVAAIDSMLAQTVMPDEIVIVKDGPLTEELETVLEKYDHENPGLFTIVSSETNIGLGLALNLGLKNCRNELVARMDTDDIAKPHRCERQLAEFAKDPELVLLGSSVDEFHDTPEKVVSHRVVPTGHKDIYEFAKRRSAFNHPTVMYKKSKVLSAGGYSALRRNQDVDLFARMLFSGCKAGNIEESLLFFRSNDALAKRRRSWENTKSYIRTIKRLWEMGYSSFTDYAIVAIAQTGMFLMPVKVQHWVYKTFLRK